VRGAVAIDEEVFGRFRSLVRDLAGIELHESKIDLLAARVALRLRATEMTSACEYLRFLESPRGKDELAHFIDAITTNFTGFFREKAHFDVIREQVLSARRLGRRSIRLWSAACATGEEPYSMAITLLESGAGVGAARSVEAKILATDISTRALGFAFEGVYDQRRLQPVTERQRRLWFDCCDVPAGSYAVGPEVRKLVELRQLNLADAPFPMRGPFDVIFIRNVMIYLSDATRQGLVREAERLLREGGRLVIGHSETLTGLRTKLAAIGSSVYERR
jgi:chemotaxis protein methyltransferase CheR